MFLNFSLIDEYLEPSISSIENEIITKIELCSQYNVVKQFNKNEIEFNIKELSSGIYYLNVTFESGKTIHSKIIKK